MALQERQERFTEFNQESKSGKQLERITKPKMHIASRIGAQIETVWSWF
jgi:hypothetical protein